MSNILDALRKAQSEQKPTKDTSSSRTEKLLSPRGGAAKNTSGNKRALALGGCGAVVLLVVGWMLYGPSQQPSKPLQQAEQVAPPPPAVPMSQSSITSAQKQAPTSSAQASSQQPGQAKPTLMSPMSPVQPASAPPAPAPAVGTAITAAATAEHDEEDSPSRRRHKGPKPAAPKPEPSAPRHTAQAGNAPAVPDTSAAPASTSQAGVPTSYGAPEGVKLSGIAWQSNRKMRRAVVNDILVGEGVLVAGAKVVEIKKNSVKFEKNGTLYETSLSK